MSLVLGLALLVPSRPSARREPAVLHALTALGAAVALRAAPADVERRLVAAGRPGGIGARQVMAVKVGGAIACGPPVAVVAALAPGRLGALLIVALPLGGFFAPDVWLERRAAQRAQAARRQLPELLDLLAVTVQAGASLPAALALVGRTATGSLATELNAAARETSLGVPLGEALAQLERRLPLPETRNLISALERARRHGSPLTETLTRQARDARGVLARQVREEAARAAPKMQLVIALLIVPSVLLLVAAALISALVGSGGTQLSGW